VRIQRKLSIDISPSAMIRSVAEMALSSRRAPRSDTSTTRTRPSHKIDECVQASGRNGHLSIGAAIRVLVGNRIEEDSIECRPARADPHRKCSLWRRR
jgi:hypothetical protein